MTNFAGCGSGIERKLFCAAGWVGVAVAMLLVGASGVGMAQAAGGPEPSKMMAPGAHPVFEVASIRLSDTNDHRDGFHSDGRHIFIENQTVSKLITFAYGIHRKQIVDAPDWCGTERYDIKGVPNVEGEPSLKQQQEMVRALLADRFKLKFRREKKELSVYAITVGKSGSKLKKSEGDPDGLPDQNANQNGTELTLKFTNNTMDDFALCMQFFLDRPIVDQSGMAGRYDFQLRYTFDEGKATDPNAPPGLFTAVQEQLGLKLEAVKAPADVVVVEGVERPSEN